MAEREAGSTKRAKRAGWALVVVGLGIALPAGGLFALITNVIPLASVMPASIQVTGPVEANTRAFVSFGLVLGLGLAILAQGVHCLARGRASWRLLVAMGALGVLALAGGALLR